MARRRIQSRFSVLPNLLSASSLFMGFLSILSSIKGDYSQAVIYIFAAALFDMLDGRVARITKSVGPFGAELDSLSDSTSFGLAPAILLYLWKLHQLQPHGIIAAFCFFSCAVVRLARFNIQSKNIESSEFQGLPTPAAAGCASSFFLISQHLGISEIGGIGLEWISLLLMIALGLLMVSSVRYSSLKELEGPTRRAFYLFPLFAVTIAVTVRLWQVMFFVISVVYILGGLIEDLRQGRAKRLGSPAPETDAGTAHLAAISISQHQRTSRSAGQNTQASSDSRRVKE